jgi:Zn-dependent peptidase ImmA (M78 family)
MITDYPSEQVSAAIDSVASEVLAEASVTKPPIDAFCIAERLGLAVLRDGQAGVRARFVRFAGESTASRPTIYVADDPRAERRQWAVAHEIGEHCAHRVFENLGLAPLEAPPAAREEIANLLAGRVLLPRDWFFAAGAAAEWDLLDLKARFVNASHEIVARRMLEMPVPVIITLWDQQRMQWRRGNLPARTPPLTLAERDVWQAAHSLRQPARCNSSDLPDGIDDIRAWPIHEPEWRREIVRTQLADEW